MHESVFVGKEETGFSLTKLQFNRLETVERENSTIFIVYALICFICWNGTRNKKMLKRYKNCDTNDNNKRMERKKIKTVYFFAFLNLIC